MCFVIDLYGPVLCATYGQVYWWVNKVLRKTSYACVYLKLLKTLYCSYIVLIVYLLQLLTIYGDVL